MHSVLERIDEAASRSGNIPTILAALRQEVQAGRIDETLAERCLDAWERHRIASPQGFLPAAYLSGPETDFVIGQDGTYVEARGHKVARDFTNSYRPDPTDLNIARLNSWIAHRQP